MEFKFLHAADIHLDSPLRGLSQYGGVPAATVRTATRVALDNLVARAIEEKVAFVIIAGDLYDGDWEAFATGLYFCRAMGRLEQAGIDVFLVYGNHDAQSHLTRQLPLPENVKVFSADKPQSFDHPETGAVLHGQSYKSKDPGGDLASGYPGARAGTLNIGVLHTALSGDRGHAPYAPCHSEELAAKGYDYWALGHVHGFEVVRTDPYIVFPGNLQGRNIRETGPKGAILVSVVDGRVNAAEHVALDVVRWALVEVDATAAERDHDIQERIRAGLAVALQEEADGRPLMARVRLRGQTPLHDRLEEERSSWREAVRAIAAALSDNLWIEKLVLATNPVHDGTGPLSDEFEALLGELCVDPAVEHAVTADLSDFLSRVPAEVDNELELLVDARASRLTLILSEAAEALRARLSTGTRA